MVSLVTVWEVSVVKRIGTNIYKMSVGILLVCNGYVWCFQSQKRSLDPRELELQTVVTRSSDSSKRSYLLRHLSSLLVPPFKMASLVIRLCFVTV